jgi:hypothetical protein
MALQKKIKKNKNKKIKTKQMEFWNSVTTKSFRAELETV